MNKTLLTAGILLLSTIGVYAKSTPTTNEKANSEQTTLKSEENSFEVAAHKPICYKKATDDFGNTYYPRVDCPDKIILR